ncbi:MAG: ATP synthase subunit I [Elainella sp.]
MNSSELPIEPAAPESSLPEASVPEAGSSNDLAEATASTELLANGISPEPSSSMQEYYQLQQSLLKLTLILTGIIFGFVWFFYSLNTALNYLIGACTGVVYLKMLARNVEQLGRQKNSLSKSHLALFVGLIVTASQWDQLHIIPIFLGFLTYKAAIIAYMFQTLSVSSSSS